MTVPDSDLVNLDMTIAQFIAPRLKAFRERNEGWPCGFENLAAWDAALADMQHAFETIATEGMPVYEDHVERGLDLFRKHLQDLWL